jgi:hypothetical protein
MHVLTRKIIWFYKSKRDFNNFAYWFPTQSWIRVSNSF